MKGDLNLIRPFCELDASDNDSEILRLDGFCKLYPKKNDDEARQYLAANGLRIKLGLNVLRHLRNYLKSFPALPQPADKFIETWKSVKDGETCHDVPKLILKDMAERAKGGHIATKRRAAETPTNKNRMSDQRIQISR